MWRIVSPESNKFSNKASRDSTYKSEEAHISVHLGVFLCFLPVLAGKSVLFRSSTCFIFDFIDISQVFHNRRVFELNSGDVVASYFSYSDFDVMSWHGVCLRPNGLGPWEQDWVDRTANQLVLNCSIACRMSEMRLTNS